MYAPYSSGLLGQVAALSVFCILQACQAGADSQARTLPDPRSDIPLAKTSSRQTAVFAGGCFWGVQAVFQHVKGVYIATSGYAGGAAATATYPQVSDGNTGHAESVQVIYDPAKISYGRLLKVFFSVAHDPTQVNRQGPDAGSQYRSALFTLDDAQRQIAEAYIRQLNNAKIFPGEIATRVSDLPAFYPAEEYHQNFATNHPYHPYVFFHDRPKIAHLQEQFPELYRE